MVTKYAIMITCSQYYIMGLICILNALEYYEVKDITVYIMHPSEMVPCFDYVKDKFSYPIEGVRVEEWDDDTLLDGFGNVYIDMSCTWAEFNFMPTLKDKHEAICMMDADLLLLGDITNYLEIAAKTDLILLPHNVRSGCWLSDKDSFGSELAFIRAYLVEHWICFFSTKHNMDLMEYIWTNRFNNLDRPLELREPQEELFLFNKGLCDLNKLSKVVELPGSLWSSGELNFISFLHNKRAGKLGITTASGDMVYGIHSRFWNRNIISATIRAAMENPDTVKRLRNNACIGENAVSVFCYQGKVSIRDIRALDTRYGTTIDSFEKIEY